MSDPHEQGPVCDFCKIAVDPDETLEPIFVGEVPEPKPHILRAVAPRDGRRSTRISGSEFRLLGKPVGIFQALYEALSECPDIDIQDSMHVEEVEREQGIVGDVSFDRRSDKVGISLKIEPKDVEVEPDGEVCDVCAEAFKNL